MELLEPIDTINKRLLDHYGKFETGDQNWRVVFSDIREIRLVHHVNGMELARPIMMDQPKYSYIFNKYILERLFPVPNVNESDLTTKVSYEPVWVFEDKFKNPLPPKWEFIQLLIATIHEQAKKAVYAKYKMPFEEMQTKEAIEERVRIIEAELYGNETAIGDALNHDHAVGAGIRKRNDAV